MKFIFFFIHLPFVCSELHTFAATYAALSGLKFPGNGFFAAATLDGQQIGYCDKNEKKLVPKQDWMKRIESEGLMEENTLIEENVQQIYNNNIHDLMQQEHQTNGVHTYQGMFGCSWEDTTGSSQQFHRYAYDGEDFITLDVINNIYTASVSQAKPIAEKWNMNNEQMETLKLYHQYMCVYWLKELLFPTVAAFGKTEPNVSLLQKSPDADVRCHVTGFYSNITVIQWTKNEQDINDPALMKSGDNLPNDDGTFQRTVTLRVSPDDWKKNQYTCVVKHMGKTIQKILTKEDIKILESAEETPSYDDSGYIKLLILSLTILAAIAPIAYCIWNQNKKQQCNSSTDGVSTKSREYLLSQSSSQEASSQRRES